MGDPHSRFMGNAYGGSARVALRIPWVVSILWTTYTSH
jgi:hypothetical protein